MHDKTYSDGNYEHFWDSIDMACKLFRKTALLVANYFNFTYSADEEQASKHYLLSIREKIHSID
ncbi:MAG: aminoglycoside 6-adenylyltransferase [Lawsonibacter sp.]